jgi:serine/threonine protein kinase
MPQLGNSGCMIEPILNNQLVVKTTANGYPADRLFASANKQEAFRLYGTTQVLKTPKVHGTFYRDNESSVVMEFVKGCDVIEFLGKATDEQVVAVIDALMGLLAREMMCDEVDVDPGVFVHKFNEVIENVQCVGIKDTLSFFWEKFKPHDPVKIRLGTCHGDLTLENMIFDVENNHIYLIDFLHTYLESPLQDIVKLRQDTAHYWCIFRYEKIHGYKQTTDLFAKILPKLGLIDKAVRPKIESKEVYRLLQFMNLIRILPYAKDIDTIDYIFENIEKIVQIEGMK